MFTTRVRIGLLDNGVENQPTNQGAGLNSGSLEPNCNSESLGEAWQKQ